MITILLLAASQSLFAASHTWSGNVNGNWSNAGNWSVGGAPTIGEASIVLTFPVGAVRTTMTNDIGSLTVNALNFQGDNYTLRGAGTLTFNNVFGNNVTCAGSTNIIESTISSPGFFTVSVGDGEVMAFHTVAGAGSFTKYGGGTLEMRGTANNTLSGDYTIQSGALELRKTGVATAIAAPLTIVGSTNAGDFAVVRLFRSEQIAGNVDVVIHPNGILNLNGYTNTVNDLTVMSGTMYNGGLLRLNGDMFLSGTDNTFPVDDVSPLINGNLEFLASTASIFVSNVTCNIEANIIENGTTTTLIKEGPGTLWLKGGGNNPGPIIVNAGTLRAEQVASLGTAAGATTVANGATLVFGPGLNTSEPLNLTGAGVNNQGALQLASGTTTCSGNITVTNTTSVRVLVASELYLSGVISGPGGLRKIGDGKVHLSGASANTLAGASFVDAGELQLSKPASTRAIGSVTVTNGASLIFNNNEQMDNAGVLSLYGNASVNLTNRNETIGGLNLGRPAVLDVGTGLLTTLGNLYAGTPYSASGSAATIKGNLSLGGATRTVSGSDRLDLDCSVSDGAGVGGLWVNDASLYLLRSNSFSGPVIVKGSCGVSNEFALGAPGGGITLTNAPFVTSHFITLPSYLSITNESLTNYSSSYFTHLGGLFGGAVWNGPIVLATTNRLIFDAPDPLHQVFINGQISGSGSLLKARGHLTLEQANTYTGITEVSAGFLAIKHPQSLGGNGQGTYMGEGAGLILELPQGSVVTEPLFASDEFLPYTTNFILSMVGNVTNTWAGPITMPMPWLEMQVGAYGDGTLRLDNVISGQAGIVKAGDGKVILGGTSPNTFAGTTTVTNGTLVLSKPNGVQAVRELALFSAANAVWSASEQVADAANLVFRHSGPSNAIANLGSHTETLTHLVITNGGTGVSGLVDGAAGTLQLLGDIKSSLGSLTVYSKVLLSGGTHKMGEDFSYSFLWFHGSVQETGGAAALHAQRCQLRLAASNSFSGPLVVDEGDVTVLHPNALGTTSGPTILTNSAILYLALPSGGTVTGEDLVSAGSIFGHNQFRLEGQNTNTWAGPITLQHQLDSMPIDVGSRLIFNGPISGDSELMNNGAGTLVLGGTATNTFTRLFSYTGKVRLAKSPGVPAVGGNLGIDSATTVIVDATAQSLPTVTNTPTGVLDMNGQSATIRQLLGDGEVVGNGILTISNPPSGYDTEFAGPVTSTIVKQGPGKARFTEVVMGDLFAQGGLLTIYDEGTANQTVISPGAALYSELSVFNFGALSGSGTFFIWGQAFVGATSGGSTFTGSIVGTNGNALFTKVGAGALTLTGPVSGLNSADVVNGTLLVNTVMTNSVGVGSIMPGLSQTLSGTGTVGNVTVSGLGARISPGGTTNTPSYGKLTVNNLTLGANSNYRCEIGGTNAGVNLDQVQALGTVTLSGGFTDFAANGTGVTSNRYVVVKSASPVSGIFLNDPEGDTYAFGAGRTATITYLPNGGRDITLIEQPNLHTGPITISNIVRQVNGDITLTGQGMSGWTYNIDVNTNLTTTNWIPIGQVNSDGSGGISFTHTNGANLPQLFYRFRLQ